MKKIRAKMMAITARPPTTPPTIAPIGVDFFFGVSIGSSLVAEVGMGVGLVVVVLVGVRVDRVVVVRSDVVVVDTSVVEERSVVAKSSSPVVTAYMYHPSNVDESHQWLVLGSKSERSVYEIS